MDARPRRQGGEYGEVTSTSNCTDFQARRLNIRYKAPGQKGTRFVHTLNGTAVAVTRASGRDPGELPAGRRQRRHPGGAAAVGRQGADHESGQGVAPLLVPSTRKNNSNANTLKPMAAPKAMTKAPDRGALRMAPINIGMIVQPTPPIKKNKPTARP